MLHRPVESAVESGLASADAAATRAIPSLRADLTRLIADKDVKLQLLISIREHLVRIKAQVAAVE